MEKKVFVFLAVSLLFVSFIYFVSGITEKIIERGVITGDVITGEVITGKATDADFNVSVVIVGFFTINITSPENATYFFNNGENYTIDLNVTTEENVTNWWYTLENSTGVVNSSVIFIPNGTITAVLGYNKLTVTANSTLGALATDSVEFSVSVNNTSPIIGFIPSEFLTCEGNSFSYTFSINDSEGGNMDITLNDFNPFFVSTPPVLVSPPTFQSEIFSDILGKSASRNNLQHNLTVYVDDGEYVDSKNTSITVIEINNNFTMEVLGAKTVWAYGVENRTFYEVVSVSDLEYGNQNSGNHSFNLTFYDGVTPFFNISRFGIMNFTANESFLGVGNASKVYNLSLCVTDLGLLNPHVNITDVCGVTGGNHTQCQNWSLTVTAQNRAPRIESFYPEGLDFNASGDEVIEFNVTEIDPDGTYPDARWYASGSLVETDVGSLTDSFSYSFGCGVTGNRIVGVNVSDGELSDYMEWNVSVSLVACPPSDDSDEGGGGGGGGSTGNLCLPLWACENWETCQNSDAGLSSGDLIGDDYRKVIAECSEENWNNEICGFQRKSCYDVNACNITAGRPTDVQACYYTENPSCSDGIKNCHDGECEILVDCGGSCGACATCSDGVQNQGEQGVDCGGPCPNDCQLEIPSKATLFSSFYSLLKGEISITDFLLVLKERSNLVKILSLLVFLALLIVLAIKLSQIFALKRKSKKV